MAKRNATEKIEKLGIDIGRSGTEVWGRKEYYDKFPSGYVITKNKSENELKAMSCKNQFYTFSGRGIVERNPLNGERSHDCVTYGAARYAYDQGYEDGSEVKINLCVTIPVRQYDVEAPLYFDYFMNQSEQVSYRGKTYTVTVTGVECVMEGYVAFASVCDDDKYDDFNTILVVDFGSQTINVLLFERDEDGDLVLVSKDTLDNWGSIKLLNNIEASLNALHINVGEKTIKDAILGKDTHHLEDEKIKSVAQELTYEYVKNATDKINEKGFDTNHPVVATSGGAILFKEYLPQYVNVIETLDEYSNARGAYEYLVFEEE